MARTVEITVESNRTDELLEALSRLKPVAGIQVQRGASVKPPGDVITVQVPNRTLHPLMRLLQERDVGFRDGSSYALSEPVALVSRSVAEPVITESPDATWEEINQLLGRESNMTLNSMLLLTVAGILATFGVATGALHTVIAGMIIAPGFEPLTRISLGLVAGGTALRRGAADAAKGYFALFVGAGLAAVVLRVLGYSPLQASGGYLAPESLVDYWTTFSTTTVLVSILAAAAGATLVAINRTVLTAGVMVGLALIPSASLAVAALVGGETGIAADALLRWAVDAAIVVALSALVFLWKRSTVQRRTAQY